MAPAQRRALLGRAIAFIPQAPLTALNPVLTIGAQFDEHLARFDGAGSNDRRRRALAMLDAAQLPQASELLRRYPHQLSGGMCQRVLIAMAFASNPRLVIADEPTTALDVTMHAPIIRLIADMQRQHGTAVIFITHDLRLAAQICDDVIVMYAGRAIESGPARAVLSNARAPLYALPPARQSVDARRSARALRHAGADAEFAAACRHGRLPFCAALPARRGGMPAQRAAGLCDFRRSPRRLPPRSGNAEYRGDGAPGGCGARRPRITCWRSKGLAKALCSRRRFVRRGAQRYRRQGSRLSILPKTSLSPWWARAAAARARLRSFWSAWNSLSAGRILLDGEDLTLPSTAEPRAPRRTPADGVSGSVFGAQSAASRREHRHPGDGGRQPPCEWDERLARTNELLAEVGLSADVASRLPGQLSGGQRQRINIARALCNIPKILIADEIVSGLDVSIQAQLLNLLARLRAELGFAMLFISHDLSVVRHLCSRVLVMYRGEIVEQGPIEARLCRSATFAYARADFVSAAGRARRDVAAAASKLEFDSWSEALIQPWFRNS